MRGGDVLSVPWLRVCVWSAYFVQKREGSPRVSENLNFYLHRLVGGQSGLSASCRVNGGERGFGSAWAAMKMVLRTGFSS